MKIAYLVDEFPPFFRGGLGTYAMEITREYTREGHTITVFSRNTGSEPTSDFWAGVEVHRPLLMDTSDIFNIINPQDVKRWDPGSQNFFLETIFYNFLSASKLISSLVKKDRRDFDIVVSHDWLAALGGIIAKKNLGKPFVFHFHSTEQGRSGQSSETVMAIERLAAEKADTIVTVSYAMRDELVKLGYQEQKIRVVYNGVDPEKYRPDHFAPEKIQEWRDKNGIGTDPLIFFVGRLTWVKGVDSLVLAMPQIVKEFPKARLIILGSGEMDTMINEIIHKNDLTRNVIFHNKYVNEEERLMYYSACDIAIFPSKYEPFGIVCTEAMAMGKPVVVGAVGTSGLREQVLSSGEDQNGFHINPFDSHDIAKYVILLLKNRDMRELFGKKGRERVLAEFTWNHIAKETTKVYEDTIDAYYHEVSKNIHSMIQNSP